VRAAQVVDSLLSNALRFTHARGQVSVSVRSADGKAIIEVSDSGEGFDAEQAKLLFLPFVQGSETARDGLGLGLALSRRIAELHGGTLVGTSPGLHRGARFVFTLDLDTEQSARRAAQASRTTRPADPKRILIVEDNRDAADTLQQLLHLAGYDARLAYDAAEAFEQLKLSVPDVVLCDLNLSGSADGLELARACRRNPRLDLVRLIAVSGYTSLMDVGAAREAGFEQFIAKPLSLEKIRSALATAVASS
jgi:CheY-like chemotaxis protein